MEQTLEDLLVSIGLNTATLAAFGKSVSTVVQKTADENPVKVRIEPLRDDKGRYIDKEDTAAIAAREAQVKANELIDQEFAARSRVTAAMEAQKAQTKDFFSALINGAESAAVLISALGAKVEDFFHKASEAGAENEKVEIRLKTVFGDLKDKADDFVKAELAVNKALDSVEVKNAFSRFQLLEEGFGQSKEKAFELSKELTDLSSKLSVAFGKDFSEVAGDISRTMVRGGRAAKEYGIDLSDARIKAEALAIGLDKGIEPLTDSEENQVKLNIVMKDSAKILNQLGSGLDENGNKVENYFQANKELTSSLKELYIVVGDLYNKSLIPLIQFTTKVVNVLKDYLEVNPQVISELVTTGKVVIALSTGLSFMIARVLALQGAAVLTGHSIGTFGGSVLSATAHVTGLNAVLSPAVDLLGIGMVTALGTLAAIGAGAFVGWKVAELVDDMTGLSDSFAKSTEKARILQERMEALKKAGGDLKDVPAQLNSKSDDRIDREAGSISSDPKRKDSLIAYAKEQERYNIATYRAEIIKTATSVDEAKERERIFNQVIEDGQSAVHARNQAIDENNRLTYLMQKGSERSAEQETEWKTKYASATQAVKDRLKITHEALAQEAADASAKSANQARLLADEAAAEKAINARKTQAKIAADADKVSEEMDEKFKLKLVQERMSMEDKLFEFQKKRRTEQVGAAKAEQEFAAAESQRAKSRELHPFEDLSKMKPEERQAKTQAGVQDASTIDTGNERDVITKMKIQLAALEELETKHKEEYSAAEEARKATNAAATSNLDLIDKEKKSLEGEIAILQRHAEESLEESKSDAQSFEIKKKLVIDIAKVTEEKEQEKRDLIKKATQEASDAEIAFAGDIAKTTETLEDDLAVIDMRRDKELALSKSKEESAQIELKFLIEKKKLVEDTATKEKDAADKKKKSLEDFAEAAKNQADKNLGLDGRVAIRESQKALKNQSKNVVDQDSLSTFNAAVDNTFGNNLKTESDKADKLDKEATTAQDEFTKTKKAGGFKNSKDRKKAQAEVDKKRADADDAKKKLDDDRKDAAALAEQLKKDAAKSIEAPADNFIGPLTEAQQKSRDDKNARKKVRDAFDKSKLKDPTKKADDPLNGPKKDLADKDVKKDVVKDKAPNSDLHTDFQSAAKALTDVSNSVTSIAESQKNFIVSITNFGNVTVSKFEEVNQGFIEVKTTIDDLSKKIEAMPVTGNNQAHEAERSGNQP